MELTLHARQIVRGEDGPEQMTTGHLTKGRTKLGTQLAMSETTLRMKEVSQSMSRVHSHRFAGVPGRAFQRVV